MLSVSYTDFNKLTTSFKFFLFYKFLFPSRYFFAIFSSFIKSSSSLSVSHETLSKNSFSSESKSIYKSSFFPVSIFFFKLLLSPSLSFSFTSSSTPDSTIFFFFYPIKYSEKTNNCDCAEKNVNINLRVYNLSVDELEFFEKNCLCKLRVEVTV